MMTKRSKLSPYERALHEAFSRYGRNAKEWLRKCALMLPKIERERIWQKLGFLSIHHYAAVVAGMSINQSREALRVMKKIEDKPALVKVAEEKGLHAVRPIAGIAKEEDQEFWAEKAGIMSQHTLETYVKTHRAVSSQSEEVAETVILTLPPKLARRLDRLRKRANFNDLLATFLDEVEAEEEANKPEAIATDFRYIPVKIRTYARARTGETCAFFGCKKPLYQLHHVDRFALTHTHDPTRLAPLCKEHNELVHLGLIDERGLPEEWRIRQQPDRTSAKWRIDQKVQHHRRGAVSQDVGQTVLRE